MFLIDGDTRTSIKSIVIGYGWVGVTKDAACLLAHIGTVINGVCTPPGSWFRLHSAANSLMAHVQEDSTIAHPCIVFNDFPVSCCPVVVACAMCDSLLNVRHVA